MSAVSSTPTQSPQTGDKSRWIALVVLCLGFLMIILDQTIVNVALPSIQDDLHFSQSGLAWVINAYLIAFGGLLLLVGRLGDLIGRRRIFLAGLVLFTLASLVCGISDSQAMLIGARFIQGVGGAMTSAVILGMIVTMFPAPMERARAIGVYAFVASAGGAIGLLAGGVLTQALDWHWIFFVNLPIGVVTLILSLRLLPNDRGLGFGAGADLLGALLLVSSLMLAVYAIVEAATDGWGSAHTLGFGGAAVALMAGFIARQATAANPLMPLRVFRSRDVTAANLIQMSLVAGMFGVFFLGALYMEHVLHYDPIEIGLAFLPLALGIAVMSLGVSARLIERIGARATLVPSMALVGLGIVLFRLAGPHATYAAQLLPATLAMGIGAGLAFPSVMTLAMSTATPEDSGLVSGLVNTSQQVGGAIGLSVLATLASTRSGSLHAAGLSTARALTEGYHLAFLIGVFALAAGVALSAWLVLSPHATVGSVQQIIEDGELLAAEPEKNHLAQAPAH
ncbi:MAG TPA: DHA2 family efflux MFS transporter permease subunit [Solirubrobacteraceae bacterium]|jgi:EmrB/QacA subfamily drug resistance transporter|nr:DHA2 family efflux MFS transporter permease subunit [Solirubrobacteraceae bacterium]